MNGLQHSQIGRAAVDILSDEAFAFWNSQREILAEASNFPDLFWGGENADPGYLKRYPEWRDYIMIPVDGRTINCHNAFDPLDLWNTYPPVVHYLVTETLGSMEREDPARAAKFAGILSHLIGDTGQVAHIIDPRVIVPLFCKENECYLMHTYLENIPGVHCPEHTHHPECLAANAEILEWHFMQRLARLKRQSLQTVVPMMDALKKGESRTASAIASETVGRCADLLSDLLYSFWCIKTGKTAEAPVRYELQKLEPSGFSCDSMFNYMPQIDHIPGREKEKPLPLILGGRPENGIALLPWLYPGYSGIRRAFVEYLLPEHGFSTLEFTCGLTRSADRNETAAVFEILLDRTLLWESPVLSIDSDPQAARLSLPSGRLLRLQVRDARSVADSAPTRFFYPVFLSPVLTVAIT